MHKQSKSLEAQQLENFQSFTNQKIKSYLDTNQAYKKKLPEQIIDYQLEDFKLLKCIGTGGFSRVYKAKNKHDNNLYALKLVEKEFLLKHDKYDIILHELQVIKKLKSNYIVKLYHAFESKGFLVFVLEYCTGGELFYHLKQVKRFNENSVRFYMLQILEGMLELHKNGLLYRDIKPENVLLTKAGHIKICDFGLCKQLIDDNQKAYSFCGSPEYMAPEMLLKFGHTYTLDFYQIGAVMYELLTGLPPFYDEDFEQIYEKIINKESIQFPDFLSVFCIDLLNKLLQQNPNDRIGAQGGITEIQQHPWLSKYSIKNIQYGQITPPIIPDETKNNVDESEIALNEKEFRSHLNLLENSKILQKDIFPTFYHNHMKELQKNQSNIKQQFHRYQYSLCQILNQEQQLKNYKSSQTIEVNKSLINKLKFSSPNVLKQFLSGKQGLDLLKKDSKLVSLKLKNK